jgi:type VI protein secretion system component VasF
MTAHFTNFRHDYGTRPQLDSALHREPEAARRKHDARVRALFWWTTIVVGLLLWAAVAYGVSLLSLSVFAA